MSSRSPVQASTECASTLLVCTVAPALEGMESCSSTRSRPMSSGLVRLRPLCTPDTAPSRPDCRRLSEPDNVPQAARSSTYRYTRGAHFQGACWCCLLLHVASRCSTVPMYRSLVGFGFGYTASVTDRHSMSSGGQSVDSFLVFWILHTFSARLVRMPRVPVCVTG